MLLEERQHILVREGTDLLMVTAGHSRQQRAARTEEREACEKISKYARKRITILANGLSDALYVGGRTT